MFGDEDDDLDDEGYEQEDDEDFLEDDNEEDDFDKDDDDDFELEDVGSEEDDAGIYITVGVGSSDTEDEQDSSDAEDEEDDWDNEWEEEEYSYEKTARIPHDFIKRDYEEEKRVGIKDIHFYCHWMPDFDSILIVQGEIIAENLKGRFALRGEVYDEEGDLIEIAENCSYTGGSGFVVKTIMPEIFFNRYPFEFEFDLEKRELPKISIVPEVDEDDEEEVCRAEIIKSISALDIEKELAVSTSDAPIMVSRLGKGEKIPKSLVQYVIEEYIGISEIKSVFFKGHENDGEYWTNQLSFTTIFSGKVKTRSLMYFLFYNEENELVEWLVKDIWDKNYKNKTMKDFVNLPLNVKIERIIVYVGVHPSDCIDMPDELKKLDKFFG